MKIWLSNVDQYNLKFSKQEIQGLPEAVKTYFMKLIETYENSNLFETKEIGT